MEIKNIIVDSLKYIEENISESITAEKAGYLFYYFSRMFKKQMGLSVMEYVKERRLIKASEEIANGKKIIDVAILLSELGASEDSIIAGLLHDIYFEKTSVSFDKVRNEFSERIAKIIRDVAEFTRTDNIKDEDVIMVKLADRLHNMRTIEFMDKDRWNEKAKETIDIFLPIAAKSNNDKVIAELSDLSLKYI